MYDTKHPIRNLASHFPAAAAPDGTRVAAAAPPPAQAPRPAAANGTLKPAFTEAKAKGNKTASPAPHSVTKRGSASDPVTRGGPEKLSTHFCAEHLNDGVPALSPYMILQLHRNVEAGSPYLR